MQYTAPKCHVPGSSPLRLLLLWCLLAPCAALAQPEEPADEAAALWAQATLYRDEWGTPHVYAETPRALGFAFGQAQAEDHLEAMLMAYRTANGRAAEVLGEKMAPSDEFALRMGHARLAEEVFPALDDGVRELCIGFAMGVNAWLLDHEDTAPAWAEGVKPSDPIALWHAFIISMAPLDLPGVNRPPRAMETGNAWALAPSRTESGNPLLVINPHNYFQGPFRWYEAHLASGDMDIAGATLFGLPLIVQGHNGVLGWALTPNFPDFADVFQEDPQAPLRNPKSLLEAGNSELAQVMPMLEYLTHAQPYYVRTESGMQEKAAPAMLGPHGPLFDVGGNFYSWAIGGFGDFGAFSQLLAMATATSLEAFQEALTQQQLPCFNVLYADRDGNLFYLYNAKAGTRDVPVPEARRDGEPVLEDGPNWARPVPAASFEAAWGNLIALDQLPSITNPDTGYLQACGGPPWACTDDADIDPTAYPGWFVSEVDTFRARRVRQLLRAGTRNARDMQAMLYDVVVPAASEMSPLLLEMADSAKTRVTASHPDLETGLELLRGWNYTADITEKAMTFYHVWWSLLTRQHARDFASEADLYDALAAKTPAAQDAALGAAADAARLMRNDLDTVQIPWGDVHRIVRGGKEYAVPGAGTGEPIFIASDYEYGQGKWQASYGYGVAMVIEFGDTPEAVSVSAFGASEDTASTHYSDHLPPHPATEFTRTRYLERDVLRHAASGVGRNVTLYPLGAEGQVTFASGQPARCTLESSVEAPGPLPGNLAAFTVFVRPAAMPTTALSEVVVSFAIPAELCADENTANLALYAFAGADGWRKVENQTRDDAGRVLTGTLSALEPVAVLGPVEALIQPEPIPAATPPKPDADTTKTPPIITPEESGPKGESAVERGPGGVLKMKLKGEYKSEVSRAPKDVDQSDRGVRVLRLRGQDFAEGAPAAGGGKGKVMWVEGISSEVKFDDAVTGSGGENPLISPPISDGGPQVLKLHGGYTRGVDTATPAPEAPGQTPLPQSFTPSPEGGLAPAAPQPAPQAPAPDMEAPQEPQPQKEESRRERKRREKEEAEAASRAVQSIDFSSGGYNVGAGGAESGDGFGDTPADTKKQKKKKRDR